MKQGYVYIHEGKVVVNPEMKPKPEDYVDQRTEADGSYSGDWHDDEYYKALSAWEKNLVEVENVEIRLGKMFVWIHPGYGDTDWEDIEVEPGQSVIYEGAVITKIN